MKASDPLPRLPYLLLGALTAVAFGGPFAIVAVVWGGPSARWPPDRLIEWAVLALVFVLFVILFVACVSIRLWYHPASARCITPASSPRDDDVKR